jgi:hypothetical protein
VGLLLYEKRLMARNKAQDFEDLLKALIDGGKDFYLTDGQSSVYLYLEDEHYRGIKINRNGTWELE